MRIRLRLLLGVAYQHAGLPQQPAQDAQACNVLAHYTLTAYFRMLGQYGRCWVGCLMHLHLKKDTNHTAYLVKAASPVHTAYDHPCRAARGLPGAIARCSVRNKGIDGKVGG